MHKNNFLSMEYTNILKFWFEELRSKDHFMKSKMLDTQIKERFGVVHAEIVAGKHEDWCTTAEGTLAYVIVLDQFSRNMFRDTAESFEHDAQALRAAREGVAQSFDVALSNAERVFLYMPYMHSEEGEAHEEAVTLFQKLENKTTLEYELLHKKIIDQFGRYPHRNTILGRITTPEEQSFMDTDAHSSF